MINFIKDASFFCSWSGGKDSTLALYRAMREGGKPKYLLNMMTEDAERSRSHGLPISVIQKQALSLNIPLITCATSWNDYENKFVAKITKFKEEGIEIGVFGDIDLELHREWVEKVCSSAGIQACEPLWKEARSSLLKELIDEGFKTLIISVKENILGKKFLGKKLTTDLIREIELLGIDASGEAGEYHTVVTDGPIFSFPIHLEMKGQVARDGYRFLDVSVI